MQIEGSGTENATAARLRRGRSPYLNGALTPTSWLPNRELGVGEWVDHGRRLGGIGRGLGWWIGDWVRYGNMRFGERYVRASRITGYDVQTLMNMVYVASAYEASQRHDKLSWSHHAELTALEPAERERWLDFAERNRLSVRCLREELRREHRRALVSDTGADPAGELAARGAEEPRLRCPHCGCPIDGNPG